MGGQGGRCGGENSTGDERGSRRKERGHVTQHWQWGESGPAGVGVRCSRRCDRLAKDAGMRVSPGELATSPSSRWGDKVNGAGVGKGHGAGRGQGR